MQSDLSLEAKQTFQVVALLATILVVGIHYQSDVPDGPQFAQASCNELAQEFVFGGIGRVAVPLFAFAAGFFYFRSDDGSLSSYLRKLKQRSRSVLLPYYIIASIATACWLLVRRLEGDPIELNLTQFLAVWLLRPPAEQLWFLRDLMVLVMIAPAIGWMCRNAIARPIGMVVLATAWAFDRQCFPQLAGWHLLHLETLFFFAMGAAAVFRMDWIERIVRLPSMVTTALMFTWLGLVATRVVVRPDFDIWYTNDFGPFDLMLHQCSILVGCIALFSLACQMRSSGLIYLSGGSFFVFLVHEFPLRAVVQRVSEPFLPDSISCWIITPLVVILCFSAAVVLSRVSPPLVSLLTGGRTPMSVAKRSGAPLRQPTQQKIF